MSDREPPPEGASAAILGPRRPVSDVRSTYHRLRMGGLTPAEAGNLTAHVAGLRVCGRSWTLRQIEHLVFLRSIVDAGRIDP